MHATPSWLRRAGIASCVAALSSTALLVAPAAHADTRVVSSDLVDLSETRATGHNDFLDDGVRVWTEGSTSTDKAAGYFDVGVDLADAGEPSMEWVARNNNGGSNVKPSVQLRVDFDADGTIDGTLVGEPTYANGSPLYGDNWWLTNGSKAFAKDQAPSHSGGYGSTNNGTLDQWRDVFPDARILQSGWSLGSGVKGDGVIYGITVGDRQHLFEKGAERTSEVLYESDIDLSGTRSKGHNDFRPTSGVRVWTEGDSSEDRAQGFFPVGTRLAEAGEPSMEWTPNNGNAGKNVKPGIQLRIDIDGDGVADGTLVGEPTYADGTLLYGRNWWLTNSSSAAFKALAPSNGGGFGSEYNGTLAEWRDKLPGATVVTAGWSLGSGVLGDGIVRRISVGTKDWAFTGRNRAPQATNVSARTTAGVPVTIPLTASDADDDDLTYATDAPNVTVDGAALRLATPADAVGIRTISYTVSDGRGGSANATATVTVAKATSSTTYTVSPATGRTTKRSLTLTSTTKSTGAKAGARVDVYDGSRRIASGTVAANGRAVVTLGKLKAGKHPISVRYRGTAATSASNSVTKTVTVTKG
ncbi:MAG: Ig-like domain repeat protein [Aeromicrobium erythreum]